ncbi:MAG: alpha/beta hydrolase [Candidatus Kariarchaeaceae archaeon]
MFKNFNFRIGSLIFVILLIIGLVFISQQQFSDGLDYDEVDIKEGNYKIKGLITYPSSHTKSQTYPGVVIYHGFSATKEMMRGFSEEFARQGFIALTVDALGHGESSHGINGKNALKDTGLTAFHYFLERTDIDISRIGLVGHSMGGSILTQVTSESNIPVASVVIGNSLNPDEENPFVLNQTSPANLLVAMGTYDELFTIKDTKENIAKSMGLDSINIGQEYGDFANKTARKVITPNTDHLLEIIDSTIIENAVSWISTAVNQPVSNLDGMKHVKHQLFTVLIALFVVSTIILILFNLPQGKDTSFSKSLPIRYHSLISISGFVIGFPFANLFNSLFTGLFVGWFLSSGLMYLYISSKYMDVGFKETVTNTISLPSRDTFYGIGIFLLIFLPLQIMFVILPWDLRFALPLFSYVNLRRITQIMLPIMAVGTIFFLAEYQVLVKKLENPLKSSLQVYLARSWVFMIILFIHYTPIILVGFALTPIEIGFLAFFLVGFVPVIFLITVITEFSRFQNLHPIIPSIIASGIISWVLASTLPFA